ncbi:putative hydrolytic protein [Actinacidiphila reveromycinica]|uniref:Putative hydrolytic protein n=1 Tax=Actinacidiphila reveromycinica TaxID=659352 RepID=A0A7U3VPQ6_9ACTN|nr:hydrolase [Streptomyces sp. SN-593]BBA98934.1 putative hydrolytic protein [Streptomyces sp. SN-593]
MSLWTSLEPPSATVDAGSSTIVRLRLRNTGDVVDEYRFTPVGDLAPYITVEPPTLRLYPGTVDTVQLTVAPPRTPDATAGPNPYGVQVVPTENPEATTVPEGNITITPFTEVRAELVPHTVKGRFRGRPKLAVDNLGNTKLTASIVGTDNGDQIAYEIHPANVQIEPGRAAFVKATLRPQRITWFGRKENRPFRLAVQRSGATPLDVDGTWVQRGVLPRFLATFLGLLVGLVVAAVALWFAYKPQVGSLAQPKVEQAVATTLPTPTPSLTTPPPTTQAPTTPPPPTTSGTSGGGASTPKKKAPPATAATAVKKLAANDPTGRHICYRVYVADKGWTKPSCDGVTAGSTDDDSGTIEALNVAVSGVGGTSGNAYRQDGGWNNVPWKGADDEADMYVGTTGKGLGLSGFAVGVKTGDVCRNAYLRGGGWGGVSCNDPTQSNQNWIFGGTTDETKSLTAVRLTV